MAMRSILIFVTVAALACAGEIEDNEQKKRGAGKTSLNAIPTGAQKPEYTYSIYQSPSQSNQPSPSYQTQVPNSFYPTQGATQYYASSPPTEASHQYSAQPQINLIPPPSTSQFVPLNFVPNSGYQSKYQIIPSKTHNGNIQLAIIQQPQPQNFHSQSFIPYHQLFSPNPTTQFNPSQGQFNVAQNYQLPVNPYLGHQSTMLLLAQPNPSLYNNLVYPNPVQSFYNYYTPNTQPKYNNPALPPPSSEYEKIQGPVQVQSITKDDNDLSGHSTEYITTSDSSNYKNAYTSGRTAYSKL